MAEIRQNVPEQAKPSVDREARLKSVKERQNEERQKKLEEIKAQAFAAQRFKEQKEEERRRRLEDLRQKDDSRRVQVEEKRKAINEAEKKRFEYILKKNQDREHRIEIKKRNERSNAVFAFGSSTPRNLEPVDLTVSFWGQRKATSIQNISSCANSAATALTRRQSERELDVGNKKRATSATGLERSAENAAPTVPAGCASGYLGRRRTDLVPTIPSSRDSFFSSSRKSLNHSPGRAYSMTRLDQLAKPRKRPDLPSLDEGNSLPNSRPLSSSSRISSITRSMSHLAVGKKPSPTGSTTNSLPHKSLDKNDSRSMHHLATVGVHPVPRATLTTQLREQKLHASTTNNSSEASSRPSSSLSHQSTNSVASSVSVKHRISTTPRKRRPISIAVTGISTDLKKADNKPPLPKPKKSASKEKLEVKTSTTKAKSPVDNVNKEKRVSSVVNQNEVLPQKTHEIQKKPPDVIPANAEAVVTNVTVPRVDKITEDKVVPETDKGLKEENVPELIKVNPEPVKHLEEKLFLENKVGIIDEKNQAKILDIVEENVISKETEKEHSVTQEFTTAEKVTKTEVKEEPKKESTVKETVTESTTEIESASNENAENVNNEMTTSMTKSRITTEEEAKAAIAEKRRLIREEAERQAELERQRLEAEAKAEFERQQREEEQIRQLIELQRQQEQERLKEAILEAQKREEEERLRHEEEQKLKLLKEEAERKAREDAERQKAELQERLKNEEKEREARRKRVEAIMLRTRGKNNANLPSQQNNDEKNENKADDNKVVEENKLNGTKIVDEQTSNGTSKNGKEDGIVDNITDSEIVKNANNKITINSTDALNSNNSWRESQPCDSLM